jgi:uncharacterized protein (DUF2141 family)
LKAACLLLALCCIPMEVASANPRPPGMCVLNVHATGFRNAKGLADAAVFNSPQGWPEGGNELTHDASPIVHGQSTVSLKVPPGRYGVVVLHDENSNYKMDRDLLGIPKEGFGFSNNPNVLLKAPPFERASFHVGCPVTNINVRIIYK